MTILKFCTGRLTYYLTTELDYAFIVGGRCPHLPLTEYVNFQQTKTSARH